MFTLDDLIRSAVQTAVGLLAPERLTSLSVQSNDTADRPLTIATSNDEQSAVSNSGGGESLATLALPFGSSTTTPMAPSDASSGYVTAVSSAEREQHRLQQQRCNELSCAHRLYVAEIQRLYEQLVSVEREYKEMLEASVLATRRNVARLAAATTGSTSLLNGDPSTSTLNGIGPPSTELVF